MEFADNFQDIIKKFNIPRNFKILEIGCADLRLDSFELINYFENYFGIDKNSNFINEACKKIRFYPNANVMKISIEDFNPNNKMYDVIVCNDSLAYVDKKKILKKIYDLLKMNGLFISFRNNTYDYTLRKFLYEKNSTKKYGRVEEFIHSIMVSFNMIIYRILGVRLIHTTWSSERELKKLLKDASYKYYEVNTTKAGRYKTVSCIAQK